MNPPYLFDRAQRSTCGPQFGSRALAVQPFGC
jgi:hypothetical protein